MTLRNLSNGRLAPLRMLTLSTNESGVLVSWESVANRSHFLERSTNLAATPAFLTLATNITDQWRTISYTDTNAVGTLFCYRVGIGESLLQRRWYGRNAFISSVAAMVARLREKTPHESLPFPFR